jgi:choline-sulfatase
MLSRRTLLGAAPAILAGSSARRPNVLWLMTDEHRPDSLGCYGSRWAHSPHLDQLAAEGTLFESAYVPSPVCVPCRSSLLTANWPSTTGVFHNEARLGPDTRFMTWRFEDAGYQTASFGKKHYFYKGERQAFQAEAGSPTEGIVDPTRYGPKWNPADYDAIEYPQRPGQKQRRNWILGGQFPAPEDQTAEARNVALATEWLSARDTSRPFLLRLSLNAPHTPVVVPAQYLRLIDPDRIRVPEPSPEQLARQPERDRVVLRGFAGSEVLNAEQLRKIRHYYYARAAFADAMCGRLLEWLRKAGLLDNTIVAMTADHGTHLGDQGLLQKQTFYEQVATVPYIFRAPQHIARGVRARTPVSTLGLLPTLAELVNLPHAGVDGRSLARTLRDGKEPRREPVFSEIAFGYQGWRDNDPQVMVRDGSMKLSMFTSGATPDGALFDLSADPEERVNLFNDPAQAGAVRRLTAHIERRKASRSRDKNR